MAKRTAPVAERKIEKTVDDECSLGRKRRFAKLREEVWQDERGEVVRYNLAYINFSICPLDNGRVLGYDNSHGHHHRHFMGTVEPIQFNDYSSLAIPFEREVKELWKKEDEANG